MILSICDNPDVLSMIRIIRIFINIIRVIVPIMLIISLMIDYTKGVINTDESSISKNLKLTLVKIVAISLIFFVPTFVNLIVSLTTNDETYKVCLGNASSEKISQSYAVSATNYLEQAQSDLSSDTLNLAKRAINKIPDRDTKEIYLNELKKVEVIVNAKELIAVARSSRKKEDYEKAVEAVKQIEDESVRESLNKELEDVSALISEYVKEYSSSGYVINPLGVPYYNQCDPRWGSYVYDRTSSNESTLCTSACGYTSLAMVASGLNHDLTLNPLEVLKFYRGDTITSRGYGAISDANLRDADKLKGLNLKPEVLFGRSDYMSEEKKQKVMKAINEGKPVVLLSPGHYVTLVPNLDGKIVLLDPFYTKRNGIYTIDGIYNQVGTFVYAVAYSKI